MIKALKFTGVMALTLGILAAPTTAFAQKGWMTCMVLDDARKNAFYSEGPITAEESQAEMAKLIYVGLLLNVKDHLLMPNSPYRGLCDWNKSRKEDLAYVKGFVAHFQGLGYALHSDRLLPDPFIMQTK